MLEVDNKRHHYMSRAERASRLAETLHGALMISLSFYQYGESGDFQIRSLPLCPLHVSYYITNVTDSWNYIKKNICKL